MYGFVNIQIYMGILRAQNFSFFSERAIFIGPSPIFFGTLSTPNGSTFLDPPLQNRNICAPLDYSLYTEDFNFGQTKWDKTYLLLGTSWEHLGDASWNLRTFWEHLGNKEKKARIASRPPYPQKKKTGPSVTAC
jgi:hypothetical protein